MFKAILIGSIGSFVESSELQRKAYNDSFKQLGLNWYWNLETYRELLEICGGKKRLEMLSNATSKELDKTTIDEIHRLKTTIACKLVKETKPDIRPFAKAAIAYAKNNDIPLGFVTSTYRDNVDVIITVTNSENTFKTIVTREQLNDGKPSNECYQKALKNLNLEDKPIVSIEDSFKSALAAKRSGIKTIAYPGYNTRTGVYDFCDYDLSQNWNNEDIGNENFVSKVLEKISAVN